MVSSLFSPNGHHIYAQRMYPELIRFRTGMSLMSDEDQKRLTAMKRSTETGGLDAATKRYEFKRYLADNDISYRNYPEPSKKGYYQSTYSIITPTTIPTLQKQVESLMAIVEKQSQQIEELKAKRNSASSVDTASTNPFDAYYDLEEDDTSINPFDEL